jgi:hypothetical protein
MKYNSNDQQSCMAMSISFGFSVQSKTGLIFDVSLHTPSTGKCGAHHTPRLLRQGPNTCFIYPFSSHFLKTSLSPGVVLSNQDVPLSLFKCSSLALTINIGFLYFSLPSVCVVKEMLFLLEGTASCQSQSSICFFIPVISA